MKRIAGITRRLTQRAGMPPPKKSPAKSPAKPDKCIWITGKGLVCGKGCVGPTCKKHADAYALTQAPKLEIPPTPDSSAVLHAFDILRTDAGMKALNDGFVEMFVSREMFPPKLNVNKFVTGGIAEDVLTDVITEIGFPTKNVAAEKTVIDIEVDIKTGEETRTVGISLKNSGQLSHQPILENYRGESKADIRELPPSIIIYTETELKRARLVYLDHAVLMAYFKAAHPDLAPEAFNETIYNKKGKDDKQSNLSFKSGLLSRVIPRLPETYIVNAVYPTEIPKVDIASITRLALEHVRKAIAASKETTAPKATETEEGDEEDEIPDLIPAEEAPKANAAANAAENESRR